MEQAMARKVLNAGDNTGGGKEVWASAGCMRMISSLRLVAILMK
jgi:hypothetical protein